LYSSANESIALSLPVTLRLRQVCKWQAVEVTIDRRKLTLTEAESQIYI